jgi:hypothetical protein
MGLNKEDILDVTDGGIEVFKYFFQSSWPGLKKPFLNPFYDDTKASCNFFQDADTRKVMMVDFGNTDYSCDCFGFVGHIFNLRAQGDEFVQILEIIDRELSLNLADNHDRIREIKRQFPIIKTAKELPSITVSPERTDVSNTYIPPVLKEFSQSDLNYWGLYGISNQILEKYQVKCISEFKGVKKTGEQYSIKAQLEEPIYGYMSNRYLKIYRPFSSRRFYYAGNLQEGYVFGLNQLPQKGDILFITSGEKDVMSLASRNFNSICFNSETKAIPKKIIRRLHYRFRHIVILYDCDETGRRESQKQVESLKEFDVKELVLPLSGKPKQKDISDFFKIGHTPEELMKIFTDVLDSIYQDTLNLLASFEVHFNNPPESPDAIVSINEVPVGSAGNLMAITGSEGSGKSNYLGALLAGTMASEITETDLLGADVARNENQKAVLFYDTEQSEEQLFKNLKQIVRRAKVNAPAPWFRTFGLVGMSRKDRLLSILQSMDRFYYAYGGIHMVVIDGIADLIDGVNDEERSVFLIEELFRLAAIYKTCVVCVLHLSPSGYKLRGHLGSEIQRKAAGILSIEKGDEKQNSIVKALKVRDGSPLDVPQVIIGLDDELKYHVKVSENYKYKTQDSKLSELKSIACDIFKESSQLTYGNLANEFIERLGVKDRQAKNYIKTLKESNIICQIEGESGPYSLVIHSNPDLFSS